MDKVFIWARAYIMAMSNDDLDWLKKMQHVTTMEETYYSSLHTKVEIPTIQGNTNVG